MDNWLRRLVFVLALVGIPTPVLSQVAGPPFGPWNVGDVISPDEVYGNDLTIYQAAVNKSGGAMTGLLVTQDVLPDVDGGRSLGNSANRYNALWLSGQLNCSAGCIGASAIAANAVTTAAIADSAVTNAKIVGVLETKVTGTAVLARLAGTQTFTGLKSFTQPVLISDDPARLRLFDTAASVGNRALDLAADANHLFIRFFADDYTAPVTSAQFSRSGNATIPGTATVQGGFAGAVRQIGKITPSAIAGTVNNWAPTGLSTASIITVSASSTATVTGLVAQPDGTRILLINVGAANTITLLGEDTGSTAANRFSNATQNHTIIAGEVAELIYVNSRWRVNN